VREFLRTHSLFSLSKLQERPREGIVTVLVLNVAITQFNTRFD